MFFLTFNLKLRQAPTLPNGVFFIRLNCQYYNATAVLYNYKICCQLPCGSSLHLGLQETTHRHFKIIILRPNSYSSICQKSSVPADFLL